MGVIAPVSGPAITLQVNNSQFQIVIVDDYKAWRNFIASVLTKQIESCVIREAADGLEAVNFAVDLPPDLVTMDLGLPGLNGIEAAKQILKTCPNTKILFISENRSSEIVQAVLAAGGMGYVVKSDAAELMKEVQTIIQGGRYVSQALEWKRGKDQALLAWDRSVPEANVRNGAPVIANSAEPHFKQTCNEGNTHTVGLVNPSIPGK